MNPISAAVCGWVITRDPLCHCGKDFSLSRMPPGWCGTVHGIWSVDPALTTLASTAVRQRAEIPAARPLQQVVADCRRLSQREARISEYGPPPTPDVGSTARWLAPRRGRQPMGAIHCG